LPLLREIIDSLLKELKVVFKEYMHNVEASFKKRLQRLLISGIIMAILVVIVVSLIGSVSFSYLSEH
jgi:hypothetical protein